MLRAAIVGLGKVGCIRLNTLLKSERIEVSGYFDITEKDAPTSLYKYSSYEEILESNIDCIFLCGYANTLVPYTRLALSRGKHVFCEKPPALNVSELESLDSLVRSSRSVLKYGFNHRFHDSVREGKAILDAGRLGKILSVRGVYGKAGSIDFDKNWRNVRSYSGGGILMDQGIHLIDLILHYLDEDVSCLHSMIATRHWNIEFEDNAMLHLRSRSGVIISCHSSATQWDHTFSLELYGALGALRLSGLITPSRSYAPERIDFLQNPLDHSTLSGRVDSNTKYFEEDQSWERELDEFLDAILLNIPIINGTYAQAIKVMRIIDSAYAMASSTEGVTGPRSL